jgi:hypothetical protein
VVAQPFITGLAGIQVEELEVGRYSCQETRTEPTKGKVDLEFAGIARSLDSSKKSSLSFLIQQLFGTTSQPVIPKRLEKKVESE